MGLKRTLVCIGVCLCGALPAWGYTVRHDGLGRVLRWPASSLPVSYRVGVSGAAAVAGEEAVADEDAVSSAVVRAFQTWNRVPGSYFRLQYAGRTATSRPAPDGENCVIWVTAGWRYKPETIAYTTVWIDAAGRIIDADIELNAERFVWSADGEAGAVDTQNAVTHECGHVVGLAHSLDSTSPTMFPIVLLGEVLKRSLEPDDLAGVRVLYPLESSELAVYAASGAAPDRLRPMLVALPPSDGAETPSVIVRTDLDGDGVAELGLFRGGERPSLSIVQPDPAGGEPLEIAYDEWTIPAGGEIEDAATLDVDGDGLKELLVLKYDATGGRQEVLVYDMPDWGQVQETAMRPPMARDAWRIPKGGNVLAVFALRHLGGTNVGVVRAGRNGLELELTTPPQPGDLTEADAERGESVPVLLPEAFTFADIEAADVDGDGVDEVVVLDQEGADATVSIYDLAFDAGGPAPVLKLRSTMPLEQAADERALAVVGLDLEGRGADQLGILRGTIR